MLSQDRINTSTVDSVYTRIDHPVEVQRGEKSLDRENEGLSRYSTASPNFIKAAHSRVVIPTASYNKWDCFSWRNRNKVAVCTADLGHAVHTPNLKNDLEIMDAATSVMAQQALEVNNLLNITENNQKVAECKTQVVRTSSSPQLPSIEGGYRRLTLREKLAKQRSERDVGAEDETPPSSKDHVAPVETEPVNWSTLRKSASVDVCAAPGIEQHQPAVRSSSANAITEERTIFGYKIMKGAQPSRSMTASKQNEQRSSVAVRSGNVRKPRHEESDRPRRGISEGNSNAALFYSPRPADLVKVSSLGKSKEDTEDGRSKRKEENLNTLYSATDVCNTEDKIGEVVEVEKSSLGTSKQDTKGGIGDSVKEIPKTRATQVADVPSAEDNVGEIVDVKEKQKGRPMRRIIIRTESLEEGKSRLREFREKQRKGKLTRSLTNPDSHDGDETTSKSKNIAESLHEIRERIRERRRKKDDVKRSQSVPTPLKSGTTPLKECEKKENKEEPAKKEETAKTEEIAKKEETVNKEETAKTEEIAKIEETANKEETAKTEEIAKIEETAKEEETAKKEETANKEETAKKEGTTKKERTAKKEETTKKEETANKEETAKKEETTKKERTAKKEETTKKERTEEDKGVTLDETERPTVTETVTQTDHNETKLDSSDKSERNVASTLPSTEENNDGSVKEKPAESKKTAKRERRKLERYQRSKTMSAIMYSDIHSSAAREMAHKDDGAPHSDELSGQPSAIPSSVSEIKKRFLESEGASSKMSPPGLFYSQKVLPPRKASSKKEKTKDSAKVSRQPETVSSLKKSESSSQKEEKLSESNSRNFSRRHTVDDSRHNGTAALRSPDIKSEEPPQGGGLLRRRHTFGALSNYIAKKSDHSPSLKASESVKDRRASFAQDGSRKLVSNGSQENKPDEESSLNEQCRRRIKSDGEVGAKMRTSIYMQVGNGTPTKPHLGRRHTIDIQPATGGKQESESAKQDTRKFVERFLSKYDEVSKKDAARVEHKETQGGDGSGKKKKQEEGKTTVSRLRKLFLLGRPASAEKKAKTKERRAKTVAGGISPEIMKEIAINTSSNKDQVVPNASVVEPDLYYVAESSQEKATDGCSSEDSQRLDKGRKSGISVRLTSPSATDLELERYLSDEPSGTEVEEKKTKDKQGKHENRGDSGDGATLPSEGDSPRDPESCASTSEHALNDDSGVSIKDQCLDDYLTTIKTLTSSPKIQKSFSKGSPLKLKFKGMKILSREMGSFDEDSSSGNQNMKVGLTVETSLTHSWSTSDLDKLFYGAGETTTVPHVASEMELSAIDFDEISDKTPRLQSLTEGRTKTRPRKNRSKSLNPLKLLQERTDLRTNTEEPVEEEKPEAGFEKVKKRSTPRKKRSQLEPWRRHTLDPVAIAALASREDFSRVSLRKTKGPGKDKDEFDGSLPVMLIQIKGRRQVQTRLVEPKLSSLNSGDCFVLVTPKELFCWIGSKANTIEKAKAVEISSKIQKRGDLNCKTGDVLCIDEAKQVNSLAYKKFCKILEGDTSKPIEDARLCPDDEFYERELISTNMVYKVQEGDPPHLVPVKELCGHMPRIVVLNTKEVFVFDFGSELYLWNGQQSLSGRRKVAFHLAQMLYEQRFDTDAVVTPIKPNRILKRPNSAGQVYHDAEGKECRRPAWTLFARLHEKAETLLFQEKFFDWPDPTKIIKMKGHVSSGEILERPPPIALKPYDVIEMQKPTIPLEPAVLECTNLGRGLGTPNVEVDGIMKEGDLVTTLGLTVWLVTQNKHFVLPKKSEGHFHSGDGYVIRWVYFVAKNRVVKDRRGRIRPLTGRQRCAYFFWQGNECSVSEKGAAAIMAVELDEERGPQIRVVEGKEPPHFLTLFEGAMVIHKGKRIRLPDGQDDFSDKSVVKMYCVRNEDTSEGCLVQVRKSPSSLRSRSSFVVVDGEAGHIYIWHGCKANGYHRKSAESAANYMRDRKPEEVNLSEEKSVVLTEIEEGQEPESFWKTLGGKKSGYMSLIKDPLNYDFSPRLFLLSSNTGAFLGTEILCPTRYPGRTSPFPVVQEDLYFACQPAMFILDVGDELYVWEGWMPLEITNDKKGSAKKRWDDERKLSLETAMLYVKEANNRIKKGAYLVQAGLEPSSFISHFPYWERRQSVTEMKIKEGKKDSEKKPVKPVLESFTKKYYSFQELSGDSPPDGVDLSKLESYLNDEEFENTFEMNRDLFNQIPGWRQDILKRALGLF